MSLSCNTRPGCVLGFSLIELMIVVAIVGILGAIALPAYNDHVRKARAADALAQLSSYASRLEQFYLDNRKYGDDACGISASAFSSDSYTLSCAVTKSGQGFTLTATAQIGTEGVYTLDEGGGKQSTAFKGASISGKSCWLIRGSEC